MAAKVPFTAGKSFSELGVVGKVTTVSTIISTVIGAIFAIVQGIAMASDKADRYVAEIVQVETPAIIEVELQQQQKQFQYYDARNEERMLRSDKRAIESEMSQITRGKTPDQLTADDVSRLETLRNDRLQINNLIRQMQQQQQQLQQQF